MPTNREIYFQLLKENNKYLSKSVIVSLLADANDFDDRMTLYKDFDKKKNLEVRYSGTLSKEDLAAILENPSSTKVGLTIENQTHLFKSDDFSQKLFELGVLVQ